MMAGGIDYTTLLAIWMVLAVMLVPLVGFTLRFGVTPLVGAIAELRRRGGREGEAELRRRVKDLEARVAELEAQRADEDAAMGIA